MNDLIRECDKCGNLDNINMMSGICSFCETNISETECSVCDVLKVQNSLLKNLLVQKNKVLDYDSLCKVQQYTLNQIDYAFMTTKNMSKSQFVQVLKILVEKHKRINKE